MNVFFFWGGGRNVGTTWRVQGCFCVLTQLHFQFIFWGDFLSKTFLVTNAWRIWNVSMFFLDAMMIAWLTPIGWLEYCQHDQICLYQKKWLHPPEVWRRLPLSFIFGDPIEIQTNGPQTANLHNLPLVDHSSFHPLLKKKIPPPKNAAVSLV